MNIRDLSHDDTGVKYSAYDGFIVKATEGVNYVDPALDSHIAGIRAAGKPFGLYHFVSISSDPVQQANDFKAQLARLPDAAFRPVIDSETNCADIVSRTKTLLDSVPNSILYTYSSFISEHFGNNFTGYKLWQADYRSTPQDFAGYNRIGWQYQENPDLNNFTEEVYIMASHLLIDVVTINPATVSVAGWATASSGISRVDFYVDMVFKTTAYITTDRPDVAQAYNQPDMLHSGYECEIPLVGLAAGSHKISVAAIANDGSVLWQEVEMNILTPYVVPTPAPVPLVVAPPAPEVVPVPVVPQPVIEPVAEPIIQPIPDPIVIPEVRKTTLIDLIIGLINSVVKLFKK
jgi:hypothetical protein